MRLGLRFTNNTPLADVDVALWAAYAYWDFNDALYLLMGLDPKKRTPEFNIDDENVGHDLFDKRDHLLQIIISALNNEELEGYNVPELDGTVNLKPYPLNTIEYLVSKGIEVDERLRIAVLKANNKWSPPDSDSEVDCFKPTIANADKMSSGYLFKWKNHFWDITYDGKQTLVKDSLGMKYIAELIRHKGNSIDWFELFTAVKGVDPAQIGGGAAIGDLIDGFDTSEGKSVRIYAGKDKKALQKEKQKLLDKIEDIKDYATEEEIDEIKSEIDDIEKYALDNFRKDGTLKENSGNRDKMIHSIKAAINRSLDDIEVDLPNLRKHLHNSIVVHWQRSDPSYSPAVDIEWDL